MEENAPVAFIVFNRPELTRESFSRIRSYRPTQLFIVADGPRPDRPTDAALCAEVREIVADIDWPCEVMRDYADHNIGCKPRVSSGLDWVFSHADRAIVIEDDCIPHADFFRFCNEMLDRYADDQRVAAITGDNFQMGTRRGDASYYFSRYVHVWGWATWRRAWDHFDVDLAFWPEWRESDEWEAFVPDPVERKYWTGIFDRSVKGEIDAWDYPFAACTWFHGGLTATPNVNLVTNVGFGPEATHTTAANSSASVPVEPIGEIAHPEGVQVDLDADRFTFDNHYGGTGLRDRQTPAGFLRWFTGGVLRRATRKLGWRRPP